jgi:hypothetical protein
MVLLKASRRLVCRASLCDTRFRSGTYITKVEGQQSNRGVLAGLVDQVTYQRERLLRGSRQGGRLSRFGHRGRPCRHHLGGDWITGAGAWANDRTRGQQFKPNFHRLTHAASSRAVTLDLFGFSFRHAEVRILPPQAAISVSKRRVRRPGGAIPTSSVIWDRRCNRPAGARRRERWYARALAKENLCSAARNDRRSRWRCAVAARGTRAAAQTHVADYNLSRI